MTLLFLLAAFLILVAAIVEPELLNWQKPAYLRMHPTHARILAIVMLASLVIMVATNFTAILKSASE